MAVIPLVRDRDARADVRPDIKRCLELGAVAGFTTGQMEVERVAVEIGLEVDFCREAAARAAERLVLLPPFAPAAETWARAVVLSKELYQVSRLAAFRQHLEECLEYPGATEPPKPLPYAVPFAIFPRECAPRYAVHSEVVNGF